MISGENKMDDSRFHLGSTPRGDVLFYDGPRVIEIGLDDRTVDGLVEITLFAKSLRKWEYPNDGDPLTDDIRREILEKTARLIEAKDTRVRVKIEW